MTGDPGAARAHWDPGAARAAHWDPGAARAHWDGAYAPGDTAKSWYQAHARDSMELIGDPAGRSIVDVGGGASTLVDDLIAAGCGDITVLDVSDAGMAIARDRLGSAAADVTWMTADIRSWSSQRTYDIWHDRAVLHFLTEQSDRAAYVRALRAATDVDSTVILGVFGPDGPTTCSGLPVRRYDSTSVAELLGAEFEVLSSSPAMHTTPSGGTQQFLWTVARRADRH